MTDFPVKSGSIRDRNIPFCKGDARSNVRRDDTDVALGNTFLSPRLPVYEAASWTWHILACTERNGSLEGTGGHGSAKWPCCYRQSLSGRQVGSNVTTSATSSEGRCWTGSTRRQHKEKNVHGRDVVSTVLLAVLIGLLFFLEREWL
jgi:hypothetical protein